MGWLRVVSTIASSAFQDLIFMQLLQQIRYH